MKTFALSLCLAFALTTCAHAQFVINEIDADTLTADGSGGTDELEFVELFGAPNASLEGFALVFFNGAGSTPGLSYTSIELDDFSTDANGFFLLANTAVTPLGLGGIGFDLGADNNLQNGADAVGLFMNDGFDTPTAANMTDLIDAIVYDTNDADSATLLTGLGQTTQFNEGETGFTQATASLGRLVDGVGGSGAFVNLAQPTPGCFNNGSGCAIPEPGSMAALALTYCLGFTRRRRTA